ncbi:hypothetical protein, partial [Thiorhodovibrio winogradskyi]|uniref:hypothetical protein n=1 Tax=Thiorhodovibrio winogradskyi TaxID=77007 RepID=UPI001A92AB35
MAAFLPPAALASAFKLSCRLTGTTATTSPYLTTGHRIILIFSRISVHRYPLRHYICDFAAGAAHSDQSQLLSTRAITHAQGIVNGLLARLRPCG